MSHKMGVLILHGIGSQSEDFADPMIREVRRRIDKAGFNSNEIKFRPVLWAPVLTEKEEALWRTLSRDNELDWGKIREFIIHYFADAIAYSQRKEINIYKKIHKIMHDELVALREDDFKNQDKPLVLMGHSLGAHIISNYIWDRQRGYEPGIFGSTPLEKMETLTGIITFGCNIPLFTLVKDPIVSIEFPPNQLAENLKNVAQWNNFYDPDDVLGYPLKPLSPSYEKTVHKDIPINVGNIITSWNMLSHLEYWTDNDFTKQVSEFLSSILSQL